MGVELYLGWVVPCLVWPHCEPYRVTDYRQCPPGTCHSAIHTMLGTQLKSTPFPPLTQLCTNTHTQL